MLSHNRTLGLCFIHHARTDVCTAKPHMRNTETLHTQTLVPCMSIIVYCVSVHNF